METAVQIKPRLAFAGAGWIGRARMQAVADSGLAEMVLVTDPAQNCLEAAHTIAPNTSTVADFSALIGSDDIDGIVIATPSALHMEQAIAAFDKGKAVFCQKPLGRNSGEVSAVINSARRNNLLLGADFCYRHTNAFRKIHAVIQSGELGKIFAVDLKFHNAYGPDKPWFYDFGLSGGGCALDLGIHLIDLMLYALGFPEVKTVNSSLFSRGVPVKGKKEVEDYANVTIGLYNDITVQLACSWNLAAGTEAVIGASFYGTKGGVALKNIGGSFYDFSGLRYYGTKTEILASPPDSWGGRAITDWVRRLAMSNTFNREAEQYLQSAAVLDKIYGRMEQR